MDFLRRQTFYIICALAAIAGIALGITGLKAMPKVVTEMGEAKSLYQSLVSLESSPVNLEAIEAQQTRIEQTIEDHDKVVSTVESLYPYEPLVAEALPNGGDDARKLFQARYREAMLSLFESLRAGQVATPIQIAQMDDIIANERAEREQPGAEPLPDWAIGPPTTSSGVMTKAGARVDAKARANMAAAQRIYCYATPFETTVASEPLGRAPTRAKDAAPASLDFDSAMLKSDLVLEAPYPEDVWRAQVGYWIQKDVVEAIVAVNEEAAAQAQARDERPWVGIMPVKDVISVRVSHDYVLPNAERFAGAAPGGYGEALPPVTPAAAFTQSASSPLYEVKQFTLKLVMDQRDIPHLVRELTKRGFHTLLRVAYEAVPPNKNMIGKIYGSEPVVNVVLDFDTIMLGSFFRKYMPTVVCESLMDEGYGIQCPKRDEDEG